MTWTLGKLRGASMVAPNTSQYFGESTFVLVLEPSVLAEKHTCSVLLVFCLSPWLPTVWGSSLRIGLASFRLRILTIRSSSLNSKPSESGRRSQARAGSRQKTEGHVRIEASISGPGGLQLKASCRTPKPVTTCDCSLRAGFGLGLGQGVEATIPEPYVECDTP